MPIIPIRNLGQTGVVTDNSAYNIPLTGFSAGFNVRFDDSILVSIVY